ncbi:MAG: mannose-6-phosphate isomerase, class I, partial [Bdellovibrionales bacterium]|nr:mannose-6-phosphate isomerase, class I [Bdellovibrionales bacterium]
ACLGQRVGNQFSELPFLVKVLSVRSALSIQCHPDADLAKELHRRAPAQYPDDRPKPELAIALSEVRLLYGLRPPDEIRAGLVAIPELTLLCQAGGYGTGDVIRDTVEAVLRAPEDRIRQACTRLGTRLQEKDERSAEEQLAVELQQEFPEGDPGVFFPFLLNLVTLAPGAAIFIAPNEPHAYLSGDLFECLANSDNVVRAALTTKFKDVDTLLSMLTYQSRPFQELLQNEGRYRTPCSEFQVERIRTAAEYVPSGPEILLAVDARGRIVCGAQTLAVTPGFAAFIPAAVERYSVDVEVGEVFRVVVPEGIQ